MCSDNYSTKTQKRKEILQNDGERNRKVNNFYKTSNICLTRQRQGDILYGLWI